MQVALLRLLADGQFHSGETLGRVLGVSRAAVWKQLQQLSEAYSLDLQRVPGKGYRLAAPLALLDADKLAAAGVPVDLLWSASSTNSLALQALEEKRAAPFAILAEQQSAGRGRRGRSWEGGFGENLYLTYVHEIHGGAARIEGASLAVGVALVRVLRAHGILRAQLKWPNDVLVAGRKLAGILIELSGDLADSCRLVIGIGVNINKQQAQAIDQPWTSCYRELGVRVERAAFAVDLLRELAATLELFARDGFAAFRQEWHEMAAWLGEAVEVSGLQGASGRLVGVDERGALLLATREGERVFAGGEVSLRRSEHDS